ncbi:hypothetical protein GV791_08050 [Nocardia cyriacigeorgica]|uniref:Lipoprotein n=1 Tax=Nocardia cyriacigeorgica TaxID=135487 RepID=A0A6P1CIY6_9NOCA|nr:hypothetical protein [Nocardia cyriacigeorgica]MBF6083309.1 hypothetical protein [Nocardia cyriacigeorgica]MBF6288853.1 hypothetical protein [Nocardia cyriacigeorgica]MBF6426926.1 hypothetical protein [Nocardia cyriacigeorgica]NEW32510.1 hypothetical protein [Nocardia cyriacigeorgica]
MPERRWISRSTLVVAGACAAVLLTACGGESGTGSSGATGTTTAVPTSLPATTPGATTPAPGTPLEVSDSAATALCEMIRPELSNWRVQGPTLGRIGLNAMVHDWALRNGAINAQVLADKQSIDRITTKACPDVRQEAIDALGLPDLASGLAF